MFGENEITACVSFFCHLPSRDIKRRWFSAAKIETHNFRIMKAWPVAKPIEKLSRAVDCREFARKFHVDP